MSPAAVIARLLGLGALAASQPALALLQSCTVSATTVMFNTYDPTNVNGRDGVGTITVTCSVLALGLFENWDILPEGRSRSPTDAT